MLCLRTATQVLYQVPRAERHTAAVSAGQGHSVHPPVPSRHHRLLRFPAPPRADVHRVDHAHPQPRRARVPVRLLRTARGRSARVVEALSDADAGDAVLSHVRAFHTGAAASCHLHYQPVAAVRSRLSRQLDGRRAGYDNSRIASTASSRTRCSRHCHSGRTSLACDV